MLLAVACLTVPVINSRNASEGTWNARRDFSETKEASTSAADMSASRVEVGDGGPHGSEEHAKYFAEIRRLRAEIEGRDAEIRRLTAENELPLRERGREAESVSEGSAPDGPTDVAVDMTTVGAGVGDGGPETPQAGNLARIANDAADDADAGRKERSHVHLLAEIRRLPAENESLQEARLRAVPRTHDSVGDEVLYSRCADLPARIRWLKTELERVHTQLEVELRVNDRVVGISATLSSAPSPIAVVDEEAPNTPVLPFVDERAVRAPLQDPQTSFEGQDGSAEIGAAGIAADTWGEQDGMNGSKIQDAKIQRLVARIEHLEARLEAALRAGGST